MRQTLSCLQLGEYPWYGPLGAADPNELHEQAEIRSSVVDSSLRATHPSKQALSLDAPGVILAVALRPGNGVKFYGIAQAGRLRDGLRQWSHRRGAGVTPLQAEDGSARSAFVAEELCPEFEQASQRGALQYWIHATVAAEEAEACYRAMVRDYSPARLWITVQRWEFE